MRSELIRPVPLPYVDDRDIMMLAADLGPGHFTVGTLYEWYTATIKESGRKPVTKKAFGMALKRAGLAPSVRRLGEEGKAARCWLITLPWQRRGLEMLAQEKAGAQ